MPTYPSSFFEPKSGVPRYILEDKYLKGGFRVVADAAARDAIDKEMRKRHMIVITANNGKVWQLADDMVTFNEIKLGGDNPKVQGIAPISVLVNGDIVIDPKAIVPAAKTDDKVGDILVLNGDRLPAWKTLSLSGMSGQRLEIEYKPESTMAPGASHSFQLEMGKVCMLLTVQLTLPSFRLEAFTSSSFSDANPYTFVSDSDMLSDEGITKSPDSSLVKGRRFSFVANLENPVKNIIYWRLTNLGSLPMQPTLLLSYLVLE
jgi:hypothetical protein